MTKYNEDFKLSVVEAYLSGNDGYREIGRRKNVGHEHVRKWVAAYRIHGKKGLKKKFSQYSGKFKLSVLNHMWDNNLSYRETTAIFNIRGDRCLGIWERDYRNGGIDALIPRRKGRPKSMSDPRSEPPLIDNDKRSREELLAELQYLRMENAYLKKVKALVQNKRTPTKRK